MSMDEIFRTELSTVEGIEIDASNNILIENATNGLFAKANAHRKDLPKNELRVYLGDVVGVSKYDIHYSKQAAFSLMSVLTDFNKARFGINGFRSNTDFAEVIDSFNDEGVYFEQGQMKFYEESGLFFLQHASKGFEYNGPGMYQLAFGKKEIRFVLAGGNITTNNGDPLIMGVPIRVPYEGRKKALEIIMS